MFRYNFRPHQLRHQDIYANLKDFPLNNKEKIWLAEAVCCEHGAEWHISAAECERRYSIPAATVSQWVHELHDGIEQHDTVGQPLAIDAENVAILRDRDVAKQEAKELFSKTELRWS